MPASLATVESPSVLNEAAPATRSPSEFPEYVVVTPSIVSVPPIKRRASLLE